MKLRDSTRWLAIGALLVCRVGPVPATSNHSSSQWDAVTSSERVAPSVELTTVYASPQGWVKPNQDFHYTITLENNQNNDVQSLQLTVEPPSGLHHIAKDFSASGGSLSFSPQGKLQWDIDNLPAHSTHTLVVAARAAGFSEDAKIVWKDLSITASLSVQGQLIASSSTLGPKVIPPAQGYDSARFGVRPFPVVLVDFLDPIIGKHQAAHSPGRIARLINDADDPGSMFRLFDDMSFGQLQVEGSVPTLGIGMADWVYAPGFEFTRRVDEDTCPGLTLGDTPALIGSPALPQRIVDGWYQLPGQLGYYGWNDGVPPGSLDGDRAPSLVYLQDSGCGPLSKLAYDAAQISDPEINYNDYDTNHDGLVEFFMVIFAACRGNGDSELDSENCRFPQGLASIDDPISHSNSLELHYRDPVSGLPGYLSDDPLVDIHGVAQCWVDDNYGEFDDCNGAGNEQLPAYVRVGSYTINHEDAFIAPSLLSHEYGHTLGLPDFYNGGSDFNAYNTMNLMAGMHGQHMTVFGKQEMGWVVPQFLSAGEQRLVENWREIKTDTGEIHWQTPAGEAYILSAENGDQNIHNGMAFGFKLPPRGIVTPEQIREQASETHIWYSGRGDDFGCTPHAGHNLDLYLPELAQLRPGQSISLQFKSSWDIEWDWDYGFVMITTDGKNYTSLPSKHGYTTPRSTNPHGIDCQNQYGNGLSGQSGRYQLGIPENEDERANYDHGAPFLDDEFDLSAYAGQSISVRFSLFSDRSVDRPNWFIDDVKLVVDGQTIFSSDHESGPEPGRYFPGGCGEDFSTAAICTQGWNWLSASQIPGSDHAYYLELRDRSGLDYEVPYQLSSTPIRWQPGLFIEYTDENHGYGNNGRRDHPAQHYLDSTPVEGGSCGDDCLDAAFTDAPGDSLFDDLFWQDNFADRTRASGRWEFDYNCLRLEVLQMQGEDTIQAAADLSASVMLSAGPGCWPVDYGQINTPIPNAENTATAISEGGRFRGGSLGQWMLCLLFLSLSKRRCARAFFNQNPELVHVLGKNPRG
ncbi:MAG: hypothetical protein ACSHXK_08260 [Oceanococcus sp.]